MSQQEANQSKSKPSQPKLTCFLQKEIVMAYLGLGVIIPFVQPEKEAFPIRDLDMSYFLKYGQKL
jgi:hypothetical protein